VDNSVENFASSSKTEVENLDDFDEARHALCKSVKIVCEKKFQIEKKLVSSQF
jgi:hypothetical protein